MLGIGDPTIYSDQGVSGSIALGSRPQGQRLLAALQPGDTVFASKLDRMFRDATDALVQARALGEIGVNLILLDLGTDSVTAANGSGTGKLLFTCMAAFADFDRDRIRERSLEAKAALRARGLFPGGTPPYGFRVVKEGRFSRLVPDEYEQTVIKAARLFWDQGLPMKQILAALEARGFRNRAGNPFSSGPIYRWTVWSADPDHVNISERTKAALARRKAAGQKLGNPEIRKISPLGVAAAMQNAAQRVAEVMPHIDDLIAAGVRGYREIARVLNASQIPSARGGRWYGSSVRNAMMAADRSFPAKTTAAPRCEHSNSATPKIRIVRPATQKQRQAIRQQHQKVMAALAAPRLGPVQKQTAQILAYKAEGLSTAGLPACSASARRRWPGFWSSRGSQGAARPHTRGTGMPSASKSSSCELEAKTASRSQSNSRSRSTGSTPRSTGRALSIRGSPWANPISPRMNTTRSLHCAGKVSRSRRSRADVAAASGPCTGRSPGSKA
jgi:putative DNA-invertase from lambdoid prophage Rac